MAGDESRRRGLMIGAASPFGGAPSIAVQVKFERIQYLGRQSLGRAMECAHCVPEVLQSPTGIFTGLTQDTDEDRRGVGWLCYCGIPRQAYLQDGRPRDPYPGQVFLVFVNDEYVAYNWRWEEADRDDFRIPQGADQRFRQRLL